MEKSGFFNAMKVGDSWDRIYKAENFAEYFATFIGNGVFPNPASNLQVKETSKMQIVIKAGKAWINGFIYINTEDLILDVDVADGVLNRIDKVVLRYDVTKREIRAAIKKGEFNSKPTAPAITRNADMYELALADITISAGAIKISQADITDLRLNKSMCGIVHGTVEQVDTTAIFNQFESWYSNTKDNYDKDIATWTTEKKQAFEEWYSKNTKEFSQEFQEWFETIKNKLDGDIAGNLLNSIKENTKKINSIKEDTKATLEENNKKINEKVQNFEKKISKINDDTILANDGCRYKPFMSKGIKELNKFLISNVDEGVVDGNYLYAIDKDSNLLKINLESYKKEKEFRANRSGLYKINSDKKYIYTVGNESVYKIDKNNLNLIAECKLKSTDQTIVIMLNDKYLYINDRGGGEKICKIDKSTMKVVAQLDLKENYLRSIFEDKEFLYCTTSAKETQFLKINKQTLTISSTHEYQDNKACTILCVDDNYIFAIDNKDKYILKINKNNGQILNKNENLIFKKYYNFTSYSNKNSLYLICANMIFEIDKKNLIVKSQSNYINEEKYESTYFRADDESIYCFYKDIIYMFKSVYEIKYYEKIRGEE